ncbi:unnamed protein product [Callosobruchus maculatus]|uniref:Uncharacterized protein n=1 Tax=Callosobruchus maculatus TaxID=64391 RepID=A0A653C426_CALMS|nr:unnamed protein product [Callosobruchus maculatus]
MYKEFREVYIFKRCAKIAGNRQLLMEIRPKREESLSFNRDKLLHGVRNQGLIDKGAQNAYYAFCAVFVIEQIGGQQGVEDEYRVQAFGDDTQLYCRFRDSGARSAAIVFNKELEKINTILVEHSLLLNPEKIRFSSPNTDHTRRLHVQIYLRRQTGAWQGLACAGDWSKMVLNRLAFSLGTKVTLYKASEHRVPITVRYCHLNSANQGRMVKRQNTRLYKGYQTKVPSHQRPPIANNSIDVFMGISKRYLLLVNSTCGQTSMVGLGNAAYLNLVGSLYPLPVPMTSPFTGIPTGESMAAISLRYFVSGIPKHIKYQFVHGTDKSTIAI